MLPGLGASLSRLERAAQTRGGGRGPPLPAAGSRAPPGSPVARFPDQPFTPELVQRMRGLQQVDLHSVLASDNADYLREMRDLYRAKAIYLTFRTMAGPGKIALEFGGRKAGKCIKKGSLVDTGRGLIPIEEVKPGDIIVAYDPGRGQFREAEVSAFYDMGVKKTLRVTTHHGFEVEGTPDHPLWTPEGWKQIQSLVPGDYIGIRLGGSRFSDAYCSLDWVEPFTRRGRSTKDIRYPKVLDEDLAFVLGFFVADGSFHLVYKDTTLASVRFTQKDVAVLEDLNNRIERIFGVRGKISIPKNPKRVADLSVTNMQLADFFRQVCGLFSRSLPKVGSAAKSGEVSIPSSVLRSPASVVAAFLRGYTMGDGSITERGTKGKGVNMEFMSKSKVLIDQLHTVLLKFGIVGTATRRKTVRIGERDLDYWRMGVYGTNQFLEFSRRIGLVKKEHLDLLARCKRDSGSEVYVTEGLAWFKVREVIESSAHVYDVTVPDLHNFVANGIVCHNTGFLGYTIHFLHKLPNVFFLTNTTFRKSDPLWEHLFRPLPGYPIPIAKVNVVYNTFQALNVLCHIKDRWLKALKKQPKRLARFENNEVLDDEPWIIFLLDEAGGFLTKMRSASEKAVVMQSWVDMCRKLGLGIIFVYHDRREPLWFLDNWTNVDAMATKFRSAENSWIDILLKPQGAVQESDFVPVRINDLPLVTLPWQTRSTASFDPELFPGLKSEYSLPSVWRITQRCEVEDKDAPGFVIQVLDVAYGVAVGEAQDRNSMELSVAQTMTALFDEQKKKEAEGREAKAAREALRKRAETPAEKAVRERAARLAKMPGAQVRHVAPDDSTRKFGG